MPCPVPPDAGGGDHHGAAPPLRALVVGERGVVDLGEVVRGDRCGLGFVDDLLRLRLALGRFGWSLVLTDVPDDVAELFELVGLTPGAGGQSST